MIKSVRDLYEQALSKTIANAESREVTKVGTLRGGNAGYMLNGKPATSCPRKAYLRMKGIQVEPIDINQQLLFDGGLASEDSFVQRIKEIWEFDGRKVVCEEDYPSEWFTTNGTPVTGRPDAVLLEKDGTPLRGIEKKGIFSLWTARDILERRPKVVNFTQATQYMCALDLRSYELLYVNRNYFAINQMAARVLPKPGQKYSEYLDYRYYEWRPKLRGTGWTRGKLSKEDYEAADKTEIVNVTYYDYDLGKERSERKLRYEWEHGNVKPFCVSFELKRGESDSDTIKWRDTTEGVEAWQDSGISWDSIKEWYEVTSRMEETNRLPPPPLNPKFGSNKDGFSLCDYCPLDSVCNAKQGKPRTTAEFLDRAKQVCVK